MYPGFNSEPAETDRLERLIREAFDEVPYPAGDLIEHDCDECHKVRDELKGLHWSAVPPETLNAQQYKMALLAPEAWHFYLPAFLLQGLRDEGMAEYMIITFTSPEEEEELEFHEEFYAPRLERLTSTQRDALLEYLEWLREWQLQSCILYWQELSPEWWEAMILQGFQPHDIVQREDLQTEPERTSIRGIEREMERLRDLLLE